MLSSSFRRRVVAALSAVGVVVTMTLVSAAPANATTEFTVPATGAITGNVSVGDCMSHAAHRGVDIANSAGGVIDAAAAGTVSAVTSADPTYGVSVTLTHVGGFSTLYGHLKSGSVVVSVGDHVAQGEKVAMMGATGIATGVHLHFGLFLNGSIPAGWDDVFSCGSSVRQGDQLYHFGAARLVDQEWRLSNDFVGTVSESYTHALPGDKPIMGDWNRDGIATPGIVRGNTWILTDVPGGGAASYTFTFGNTSDYPLVGDWNGDGADTIGVRRGSTWIISNDLAGTVAGSYVFGNSSDDPLVGNWDGLGGDTFGVRQGNTWKTTNTFTSDSGVTSSTFGNASDTPLVGDWNGDGKDTFGVRQGTTWILSTGRTSAGSMPSFVFGRSSDIPLVGDWNHDGKDTIGIAR